MTTLIEFLQGRFETRFHILFKQWHRYKQLFFAGEFSIIWKGSSIYHIQTFPYEQIFKYAACLFHQVVVCWTDKNYHRCQGRLTYIFLDCLLREGRETNAGLQNSNDTLKNINSWFSIKIYDYIIYQPLFTMAVSVAKGIRQSAQRLIPVHHTCQ